MAFWGRTIRSRFGQPIPDLSVVLDNAAAGISVPLSEDGGMSGFYFGSDVPDGRYDLYINGELVPIYQNIVIFNDSPIDTGYGTGPWGDVGWGAGI